MKKLSGYLIVAILFLIPIIIFPGSYHVSLKGSDSNNGSAAAPFRTIKKGVSVLTAGDSLIVHSGNYGYEYFITIKASGTEQNPIVIKAEKPGTVILNGPRKPYEVDCGQYTEKEEGSCFVNLNSSNIVIDGFSINNYSVGIKNGFPSSVRGFGAKNITIKNCVLNNNGSVGIQNNHVSDVLIKGCTFISDEKKFRRGWNAVQDYGVNFYYCKNCVVDDCYFYGEHNQALSFKEGDTSCVARRNVFEGVGHFAIFLGQNRLSNETEDNKNPTCKDLVAEYNIVRPSNGINQGEPKRKYRTKTPIVVDNVDNAIVRYNYIEGFDDGNKTCGINLYNEERGKIVVENNIVAFGKDNLMSGGIFQDWGFEYSPDVEIHHNTFYKVSTDFINLRHESDIIWHFTENIAWKTKFYKSNTDLEYNTENFRDNPEFIHGEPARQRISSSPVKPDFNTYYKKLTEPFGLKAGSPAKGFGVQF